MMCGFLSVVLVSDGQKDHFELAAWLIIIAAVADALDGVMARLTKTSSQFGVELDSLSDVISFGFAPAFLLLSLNGAFEASIVLAACLFYLFSGGFRLARFNAELSGFTKEHFKGLPIPSAAITIAAFVFLYVDNLIPETQLALYSVILAVGLGILMVSKVKYDTLPNISVKGIKQKPVISVLIVAAIIATIATSGRALFYIFLLFILYGIFLYIFSFFHKTASAKAHH